MQKARRHANVHRAAEHACHTAVWTGDSMKCKALARLPPPAHSCPELPPRIAAFAHAAPAAGAHASCPLARFFSSASAARLLFFLPRAPQMNWLASSRRSMSTPCRMPLQTGRAGRGGGDRGRGRQAGEGMSRAGGRRSG